MKKLLVLLLCAVMLLGLAACGGGESAVAEKTEETKEAVTTEPEPEEPEYEYYEGTNIPTVDSVFDVGIIDDDPAYPKYGPFSNETNLKAAMVEYCRILEDLCGFSYNSNSSDSAAIDVHTDEGIMIVYGANLTGEGYVLALGMPK